MSASVQCLIPDWPLPAPVRAFSTTRHGGYSTGAYRGLNLAEHVGDDPARVAHNRQCLRDALELPVEPHWLQQVHGSEVVEVGESPAGTTADASFTRSQDRVCAVLTADCLPLLLCDCHGTCVAAVHGGWRGLASGIVEATVKRLGRDPGQLLAWLGPAIGPRAFEVGGEVREAFLDIDGACARWFQRAHSGRWMGNLPGLARHLLQRLGVEQVYGGEWCTYHEHERFYSYRRDGRTGRMATGIWLASRPAPSA